MVDRNNSLAPDDLPAPPPVTPAYLARLNARWDARRAAIVARALQAAA